MRGTTMEGGCYCGEVRFAATGRPIHQTICYCSNCRRAAGAQSVAWLTFADAVFSFVKGTPARFRTQTSAWRTFCRTCGTSLTYANDGRPDEIDVTMGSLDHPEDFPPDKSVFEGERLSWDTSSP